MPEVLRDLVVSLSLKTDNFSRNINSINRQIREAESAFRLAGAGVDHFGDSTSGIASRLSMLQTNLGHQRDAVDQYERALAAANSRLQESHARYTEYSGRLDEARQKHQALGDAIKDQEAYLQQIADLCGTDCDAYRAEAEALERLKAEYAASGAEVKKLEGQCNALQKTMQRNADAVSRAQTELNNAKAAVRETEAEIRKLSQQLKTGICRMLDDMGILTPGRKTHWRESTILSILSNEKYKGDALLQKTFTVDFLTKKHKQNEGEVPQYYVKGNHERCPYVNKMHPPEKGRKYGIFRHSAFAHPLPCSLI